MKIAYDLRRIGNPGIGRYMKCLVEAILAQDSAHDYLLVMPSDSNCDLGLNQSNVIRVEPRADYYSVREQFEIPRILHEHGVDLLHSPHFVLPLVRRCPAVVTIHDVIYLACPQDLPSSLGRAYYAAMMWTSARLAKRVITDSFFSKADIVRHLGISPDKISVIYPAVDISFQPLSDRRRLNEILLEYGIDGDYVLYTGIYKPRKNHSGLLRSFRHFLGRGGQAQLVISGPMNEGEHALRQLAHDLGISDQVVFTGFIPDSTLCALYSGAAVYACPSMYEGFGFTVLEAMACGAPVVCSNSTSLPEVAGNAALFANGENAEEFGEALLQAIENKNLRSEMIQRGWKNVQRFRWHDAANRTLSIYDEVLGRAPRAEVAYT